MALKTCSNCGRVFSARRQRCPDCRRRHHGADEEKGLSRGTRAGMVAIAALATASVAYHLTRDTGPSPELEGLHSEADAIAECHRGIESEFSDRDVTVRGPLAIEYLQGGEYEARGDVQILDQGEHATRPIYCEAQFRQDEGWSVYVQLDA